MPLHTAQQLEETIVLCQGDQRNTARVYFDADQLMLRLYDRQEQVVWINTAANQTVDSAANLYSNQRGEAIVKITVHHNSPASCSIQVDNQPLESGTVLTRTELEPWMSQVPSPVGGTVKQVTIPGPETAVWVSCDQAGFEPFLFHDQGDWVGCQLSDGATAGANSSLSDPVLKKVSSPVGGIVQQVTIPGPETAVLVSCNRPEFKPFLFRDQGTWIGCGN